MQRFFEVLDLHRSRRTPRVVGPSHDLGNHQDGQDRQDRHHHHHFNQGKAALRQRHSV
jgi:hypothetical protein